MHVAALYHRHPVTVSYFRGDRKEKNDIVVDFTVQGKSLSKSSTKDISITENTGIEYLTAKRVNSDGSAEARRVFVR